MRWRKNIVAIFLLVLGALFTIGNIRIVAGRSTIPLELHSRVAAKEVKREKHPGKDDVCFLRFEDGLVLHVDVAVFEQVDVGDNLQKSAGDHVLDASGKAIGLSFSPDYHGMILAMPAILLLLVGTATYVCMLKQPTYE